jgi:hypothetical protein
MPRLFASNMQFDQTEAASTWTINHGLNCKPVVAVYVNYENKLQEILPGSIEYPSDSQVVIRFSQPFSGVARLV